MATLSFVVPSTADISSSCASQSIAARPWTKGFFGSAGAWALSRASGLAATPALGTSTPRRRSGRKYVYPLRGDGGNCTGAPAARNVIRGGEGVRDSGAADAERGVSSVCSDHAVDDEGKKTVLPSACNCCMCGRRGFVAASVGGLVALKVQNAGAFNLDSSNYNRRIEEFHPSRASWYDEIFARVMATSMSSYEAKVADYKLELFGKLDETVEQVLELGIGTGPNLKYYGKLPQIQRVVGVDPNVQMAKFCSAAALSAGLSQSQFEFIHGVGEVIPLPDASMDAVVCTLVLCSVTDVAFTLKDWERQLRRYRGRSEKVGVPNCHLIGRRRRSFSKSQYYHAPTTVVEQLTKVKRVLRPGGAFFFVEHVAAADGTGVRTWQVILDPIQQFLADGCHLTRDTLHSIEMAQFGSVDVKRFNLPGSFVIGPHILGVARTSYA